MRVTNAEGFELARGLCNYTAATVKDNLAAAAAAAAAGTGMAAWEAAEDEGWEAGPYTHSLFQLNVSAFCGIGGTSRGCLGAV